MSTEYNLKSIKQDFKNQGIFHTPEKLALLLKSFIPFPPKSVYDPTCGTGSLLSVFDDNVEKFGQELNLNQLEIAEKELVNFTGFHSDTLKDPAFKDRKFDCIVANPPFSIAWNPQKDIRFDGAPVLPPKSKADYAFILHILHYLSENGIAVVLNFPGILYRGNSEGKIRKWIIQKNWIDKVIHIPPKTFVDTTIATCILIFRKNRIENTIEFIDNEKNLNRLVPIKEIEENDFNLSVSSYLQLEQEKVNIDPVKLEISARKNMVKKLKADLQMSVYACRTEGIDITVYLDELENIIKSFR